MADATERRYGQHLADDLARATDDAADQVDGLVAEVIRQADAAPMSDERVAEWVEGAKKVLADDLPAGHKLWKSWALDLADQVLALARTRRGSGESVFVSAAPAPGDGDERAPGERKIDPRADVAEGLPAAGGAGGSSQGLHTHQYRGVTPAAAKRRHVVQFSTGLGSAEVLRRVVEEQGARNVVALSADTLEEDHDNWRFAREVVRWLQVGWVILADGRTPMQVGRDVRVIPNNRLAVCSRILKRELLRDYIDITFDPADSLAVYFFLSGVAALVELSRAF